MKFSEYPFLRYTLFFIAGILLYPLMASLGTDEISWLTLILFLCYLILVVHDAFQKRFKFKALFPFISYTLLVCAGIFFTHLKDVKNDPSHLLFLGPFDGYLGTVLDLDQKKPKTFANRIMVTVVKKGEEYIPATGEVVIYHQSPVNLFPGEILWIEGHPDTIPSPKNPYEFNYRKHLANQQIYHSQFIGNRFKKIAMGNQQPINHLVLKVRASLLERIDRHIPTPHSNQIAKALLLGQKKDLDMKVNEAYITAGTMHVLAVSGLHVGIIYGFFFLFVKPYQLSVRKRVGYLSIVILIIWAYALLTGMSPSVMRAATMFTLMGMAQMKSRNPSIFNSLALSALILLILDPFILFSVGFQLSYAAVFGIVILQPKIVGFWEPQTKLVYYLWEITSVGIAAQLATFPIAAHYFHVFPTYFIFSNLIAIPGAFLIMSFGIPFLLLSFVEPIGHFLGAVLDYIIHLENLIIFSFQKLPFSRIDHIHFPAIEMVLFWLLTISIYLLTQENRKKYAYLSMLILMAMILSNWRALVKDFRKNELYIYQLENGLAVDYFYHGRLYSQIDGALPQDIEYKVHPNRISLGHPEGLELPYWEEENSKFFPLPGRSFLKINGMRFEIEALSIESVSHFTRGKWLSLDLGEDQAKHEAAYRIVFK